MRTVLPAYGLNLFFCGVYLIEGHALTKESYISPELFLSLMAYAEKIGLDSTALSIQTGLTLQDVGAHGSRISSQQINHLWQAILNQARDPFLGLHFAETAQGNFGGHILSMVIRNCPTVGDALKCLVRYHRLMMDVICPQLKVENDLVILTWTTTDTSIGDNNFHSQFFFCLLVSTLKQISRGQFIPLEIGFTHPSPPDVGEYHRIFTIDCHFGCDRDYAIFSRAELARPILLANPELLTTLEQLAKKMLLRLYPEKAWTTKVTGMINELLALGQKPSFNLVARKLAFNRRYLQEKLADEGTSFRQILDEVRRELALNYLADPQNSICDVAFLLGFSQSSSFNHAYKRWTGSTPRLNRIK